MPRYNRKIEVAITDEEFVHGMSGGKFVKYPDHVALLACLQLTGLRISEALSLKKEQFTFKDSQHSLFINVGDRLKHSKRTPPLEIPLDAPFIEEIKATVEHTKEDHRVWPYCRQTGYNIVKRVFHYPHLHRLSRITNFAMAGHTIPELKSWTGLNTKTLDYYMGTVSVRKMGKSLSKGRD